MQVLVLGAENSGKSLLVKRLQMLLTKGKDASFSEAPSTISTVGSNITKVTVEKVEFDLREVGGAMAPLWKNYYNDANAVVYVIDSSNQFQISASCILLLTMLSNEKLHGKHVLIVFNKIDFLTGLSINKLKNIYRLDDVIAHAKQKIMLVECSCIEKIGFNKIFQWLESLLITPAIIWGLLEFQVFASNGECKSSEIWLPCCDNVPVLNVKRFLLQVDFKNWENKLNCQWSIQYVRETRKDSDTCILHGDV